MQRNRSMPSPSVIPVLLYPDVRGAVAWLTRVFGFVERLRIAAHRAQMTIGGDGAMIVAESIDRARRPEPGADPVSHQIMVRVDDVAAHHACAVRERAEILQPPVDPRHARGRREAPGRAVRCHRARARRPVGRCQGAVTSSTSVSPRRSSAGWVRGGRSAWRLCRAIRLAGTGAAFDHSSHAASEWGDADVQLLIE